jgi:hypothetical protein
MRTLFRGFLVKYAIFLLRPSLRLAVLLGGFHLPAQVVSDQHAWLSRAMTLPRARDSKEKWKVTQVPTCSLEKRSFGLPWQVVTIHIYHAHMANSGITFAPTGRWCKYCHRVIIDISYSPVPPPQACMMVYSVSTVYLCKHMPIVECCSMLTAPPNAASGTTRLGADRVGPKLPIE